jgi:pimeloyl-ACP methyl ester carboxylesterase
MAERMIDSNGIRMWTEAFGDRRNPTLLLVMGASAQGIQWPVPFIDEFVARNYHVIRYDNRDTGQSTCFDFAKNPYTLDDLANDAVGVLDAYDVGSAHVAGASMGGMITQMLMIKQPKRVRSATIIMSSPLSGGGGDDGAPVLGAADLKGPDPQWLAELVTLQQAMPMNTPAELVEMRVAMFTKLAGSLPVDTAGIRDVATREVARATNFAAQANHSLAIGASSPRDRRPLLRKTSIPTLVVHGTEDPILPYPHGKALADAIPGAKLLTFDRMGHDLPAQVWPRLIDAMLATMQRA